MISLQVVAYAWKIKRPTHFPFIFSLCTANYILKHDPKDQFCRSCREVGDPGRREGIKGTLPQVLCVPAEPFPASPGRSKCPGGDGMGLLSFKMTNSPGVFLSSADIKNL